MGIVGTSMVLPEVDAEVLYKGVIEEGGVTKTTLFSFSSLDLVLKNL
jgi:hypothetical protein